MKLFTSFSVVDEKLARANREAHWTNLIDTVRETQKVQREMSGKLDKLIEENNTVSNCWGKLHT